MSQNLGTRSRLPQGRLGMWGLETGRLVEAGAGERPSPRQGQMRD